jgi:hypothetical protein
MINSQTPSGFPRKASLELCKELLNALGVPLGTATVARRPTPKGDILVVRMTVPGLLPADQRPASFRGFPVTYEVVRPLKIGQL